MVNRATDSRASARVLIRAAVAAVLGALMLAMGAAAARADATNVISAMTASTAKGTRPVDSLPNTFDQTGPSPGRQYTPPTAASVAPLAGGDDNFTESLRFGYGGPSPYDSTDGTPDQTVQTLDLTLPPGLLDSLAAVQDLCTPSELGTMPVATSPTTTTDGTGWLGGSAAGNAGCPADAQIGELAGVAYGVGMKLPISGNIYLMAPSSASDVADIAVEVEADLGGSWLRAQVASGPIQFALDSAGQPELQVALALPAGSSLAGSTQPANGLEAYSLVSLTQTINGLSPAHVPFQRMPTSDATTTGTAGVSVQDNGYDADGTYDNTTAGRTVPGLTGSGSASITPTGAGTLPYAPQLSASVTRDSADSDVGLVTTITQAAGEAANRSVQLALPSILGPNLGHALSALCVDPGADDAGCTPVGTATAVSSLLNTPLSGTLYLRGTASGVSLDIVFPAPFAITISGAVDLVQGTVTFPSIPDMSLTSLRVAVDGGPDGIYETSCTAGADSAEITGGFTAQNGAIATSAAPFAIAGCPATTTSASTPTPGPAPTAHLRSARPRVQVRATRLTSRRGRLTLRITAARSTAPFDVLRLSAPAGTRFVASALAHSIAVRGARVRSVSLEHGRAVLRLRAPASRVTVVLRRPALQIGRALAHRIAVHRVRSLRLRTTVVTTAGAVETVTTVVRV